VDDDTPALGADAPEVDNPLKVRAAALTVTAPTWWTDAPTWNTATHAAEARRMRAELRVQRQHSAARRELAREERARHRRAWISTKLVDPPCVPRSWRRGPVLERARCMAGWSLDGLWCECFSLGGNLDVDELADVLSGARGLDRAEHDVIAVALNEQFADAGFGNPVDYWESPDMRT
jgi:hypothetical protein